MKLQREEFESVVLGSQEEMKFSIDTETPVIFDILRDKMYSDKIGAVCREVSSNSKDANTENGKSNVPIKISIVEPFELDAISDKSIVFQDFGTGITPDRMENIFIKYGSSTKRGGNDQIGGFGLGAKTPFAYSDTFSIITVCDYEGERKEYIYTAMIDDSGVGVMIPFSDTPTTKETGTMVVVPFKEGDRYDFEKNVNKWTCLWDVRPELSGFMYFNGDESVRIEKMIEGDGFHVIKDEDTLLYSQIIASVDGIPYKIDASYFKDEIYNLGRYHTETYPIVLELKTGEIDLPASREMIDYTERTVTVLKERLESVITSLKEKVIEYVGGCDTYLESCIRYSTIKSEDGGVTEDADRLYKRLYHNIGDKTKDLYTWNGETLKSELNLKHHIPVLVSRTDKTSEPFSRLKINKITVAFRNDIYFNDLSRTDNKRNTTLTENDSRFILLTEKKPVATKQTTESGVNLKDEFLKLQKEERDWINRVLSPKMMSSVEQTQPEKSTYTYTYVESEEVNVPCRHISKASRHPMLDSMTLTWLRSQEKIDSNDSYLFYVVDTLGDVESGIDSVVGGRMQMISHHLSLEPIVVSKSRMKYFEGHKRYSQELWDEIVKDEEFIKSMTTLYNKSQVNRLKDKTSYKNMIEMFPEFIDEKFLVESDMAKGVAWGERIVSRLPEGSIDTDPLADQWDTFFNKFNSDPRVGILSLDWGHSYINRSNTENRDIVLEMVKSAIQSKDK